MNFTVYTNCLGYCVWWCTHYRMMNWVLFWFINVIFSNAWYWKKNCKIAICNEIIASQRCARRPLSIRGRACGLSLLRAHDAGAGRGTGWGGEYKDFFLSKYLLQFILSFSLIYCVSMLSIVIIFSMYLSSKFCFYAFSAKINIIDCKKKN